jgi:predicted transcriptional regulator
MEVHFKPETLAEVNRVAAENRSNADEYVQKLVESYIRHDEWFRARVREGVASADGGELLDHEEVGKLIDSWFPG